METTLMGSLTRVGWRERDHEELRGAGTDKDVVALDGGLLYSPRTEDMHDASCCCR